MKRRLTTLAMVTMLAISGPALADRGKHRFTDKARVVEAEPIYQVIQVPNDRTECWQEEVTYRRPHHRDNGGMIVGGVIGGIIGSQIGHGRDNKVATVAGTIIGATIGNDASHDHRDRGYTTSEQRCRVVTEYRDEERISGYRVTYRYQGRTYTSIMDDDPGRFVRVRVRVEPIER